MGEAEDARKCGQAEENDDIGSEEEDRGGAETAVGKGEARGLGP